jgi:hypothetical protein
MLPDMSYNPLRESGSGEDDNKVRQALKMILDGGGTGAPEFGSVAGSAEHKALMMMGGNTGRFAGNYAVKNYDKLDPMVKELIPLYGEEITEEEDALEKQKNVPALPRLVESARRRQSERKARAKQPKASFLNPEMENVGLQEGGMVPVDGEGNMPPEAVADDVINGAPVGMVDVPGGGGPTDDGVPTKLPEGSFVLNAAAIQYHGTKTINDLINNAVRDLLKEGVQISMEDPNPEDDVPVAISNGEYVIPPEVAEKIGIKKLEDMNERGLEYRKKQDEAQKKEAEAQQQQPQPQPQETFMGLQMPPETPQQAAAPAPAPVQSEQQAMAMMGMADGGPISKAKDAFVNWFTDTFLGGPMIPTNESADALLGKPEPQEPQKPPMLAPSVTEQKQEGGFIGQPMSPQQQPNMAISNPYGFSLDNPFSQQPSFIGDAAGNIVGSKKKSRVEFQDGSFVRLPEEDRRTTQYNNPGNLKTIHNGQLMSNTLYAGALPQGFGETNAEGLQKGYFSDPVLGTRALFVDINTKLKRFKDLTPTDQITAIVNQYAPVGKENPNQTNYRNFLLQKFKDNPDQDIARTLVEGIIQFENNPTYEKLYTTEVVNEAEKLSKYDFDWNKIKTLEDARKSILST